MLGLLAAAAWVAAASASRGSPATVAALSTLAAFMKLRRDISVELISSSCFEGGETSLHLAGIKPSTNELLLTRRQLWL
jgi:hypothetical protein